MRTQNVGQFPSSVNCSLTSLHYEALRCEFPSWGFFPVCRRKLDSASMTPGLHQLISDTVVPLFFRSRANQLITDLHQHSFIGFSLVVYSLTSQIAKGSNNQSEFVSCQRSISENNARISQNNVKSVVETKTPLGAFQTIN